MLSYYGALGIITANFLIAVYVLFKNPRHIVNRSFFVFVFGMALWGAAIILLSLTKNPGYTNAALYGGHTMILGLVLLARTFPDGSRIPKSFWLFLTPVAALFIATPFNVFISSVMVHADGSIEPMLGTGFPYMNLVVGGYVIFCLYAFAKKYKDLSGLARLQMKYLFAGAAFFTIAMFVFDVFLPFLGYYQLNLLGPPASIGFIGFTGYAIARHQLLDIRVVIQRGTIYSGLFALIVGVYLSLAALLGFIFQRTTNSTILVSAGLTALLGIFGVPPIERHFRRATDKIFFKGRYEYPEAVHELSEILNKNLDLALLLDGVVGALERIFRAENVYMLLMPQNLLFGGRQAPRIIEKIYSDALVFELAKNPGIVVSSEVPHEHGSAGIAESYREVLSEIQRLGERGSIEVTVPIVLERKLLGVLAIGKKRSGNPYTVEDMSLLKTFASQAAVALERAELYEKVKGHARDLEKRVQERTGELERAQEAERRMMIDMSHALQTPLTVVRGELDRLKKQISPSRNLDVFEKSIENVSRLTHDLLALARLEIGADAFQKEPLDLSKLVCELVEYVTVLAEDRGITVRSAVEQGLRMYGNKRKLEELITNLLSNAIKYMSGAKKKELIMRLCQREAFVELTIEDSGIGISPEDLPNIFNRFFRARTDGNFATAGTGLGLAICKKIVENHDGTIKAESIPGKGTKFIVTLPLAA